MSDHEEKERIQKRLWRINNPEKARESNRNDHARLRALAINHYGGKCSCCGETEIKFLAIDHMNDDGNVHRKSIHSRGGTTTYRWLKKNGFPDGFQVLCHNCNMAKAFYGICPHQTSPAPQN